MLSRLGVAAPAILASAYFYFFTGQAGEPWAHRLFGALLMGPSLQLIAWVMVLLGQAVVRTIRRDSTPIRLYVGDDARQLSIFLIVLTFVIGLEASENRVRKIEECLDFRLVGVPLDRLIVKEMVHECSYPDD